ncbi:acyltransferase family protein [Staphylococcus equorum]|uniref:acyltransferase family protein n=1 Tax=Staphylococcus equorum TaxID=246432 RepID=UPI002DB60D96|nr:acyltransferase family protein [Staphylococcus equorum]MEB7673076.1 acyltransferase family protein [Staphylococcus equorum]
MERKMELTYSRAIFCIIIVILHTMTGFINDYHISHFQKMSVSFIQVVLLFATPCFIILSEVLLGMRYSNKVPKNFLAKRAKYILIPYLLFGLFVTFKLLLGESSNNSFWNIFLNIVIEGKFFGWFVLVIFQFYILHNLFYKLLSRAKPVFMLLISFIISFAHSYLMYYSTTYLEFWDFYPFFSRTIILYWLFYFVVGFYFGKYYGSVIAFLKSNLKWIILLWIMSISYIAFNFFYLDVHLNESNRFDLLLFSSVSFILVIYLAKKLTQFNLVFIFLISEISFFIYLSHQIIVDNISRSLASFVTYPIPFFILTTVFTLGFCIGLAIILSFIPYVRVIVGRNTLQSMVVNNYKSHS